MIFLFKTLLNFVVTSSFAIKVTVVPEQSSQHMIYLVIIGCLQQALLLYVAVKSYQGSTVCILLYSLKNSVMNVIVQLQPKQQQRCK